MYKLTPIISKNIEELLDQKEVLFDAVEKYGSPLNILFPANMNSNINGFQKIFQKYDIDGKIFFAHKPNKSKVFAQQAFQNGVNIDIASVKELQNAINAGFSSNQIEATGPKSKSFLQACIEHEIIINVDSLFELRDIITLSPKQPVRILLRLSNFIYFSGIGYGTRIDRFGIQYSDLSKALDYIEMHRDKLILKGFAFHINDDSLHKRISAIKSILKAVFYAWKLGFDDATIINFGGGFKLNYMNDQNEWDDFLNIVKNYAKGELKDRISFNGDKFGYSYNGQAITGNYLFQDFYNENNKEKYLDKLFSSVLEDFENRTIGEVISENLLELWIEPGQSLLDQCGITIARVIGVKEVKSEKVIFTEMNYTNLDSDRYELFTDPILISSKSKKKNSQGYFISGNLCLSIDLITNHKIYLDYEPEKNDLLVFINTAPYRMDFVESEPLQNPIAKKVVWHDNQLISEQEYISNFISK